jgi:hypothetical protein
LQVKSWGVEQEEEARSAVRELLIGEARRPPSWDVTGPLLGSWLSNDRQLALPPYLLAKNLFNRGLYERSAEYLDQALERRFELITVEREALRLRVILACALDQTTIGRDAFARFEKLEGTGAARLRGLTRFAQRCGLVR